MIFTKGAHQSAKFQKNFGFSGEISIMLHFESTEELCLMILEHIRKSKNWDFYYVLLSIAETVWAWNLQGSYVSWRKKFEKKLTTQFKIDMRNLTNFAQSTQKSQTSELTCASKNDMRNSANNHQSTFESLKIGIFIRSFIPK